MKKLILFLFLTSCSFQAETNNLDENVKKRVIQYIFENRNTFIIITHDLELVKKCNKVLILNNGKIKYFRSIKNFIKNKKLLKSFSV